MEIITNPIASALEWVPFIIYYSATFPQIWTNYSRQSTKGLSYRMVFLDYTGAITTTTYSYLLWLPMACRVMEPFTLFNIGILAAQGLIYAKTIEIRRNIMIAYTALHAFIMISLFISVWYYVEVGNMMGWIALYVQCFTQLPQVITNYQRKSVDGLNFWYVNLYGLAGFLEMVVSLILGLPMQSFLYGARAVFYYIILMYQFSVYGKKRAVKVVN